MESYQYKRNQVSAKLRLIITLVMIAMLGSTNVVNAKKSKSKSKSGSKAEYLITVAGWKDPANTGKFKITPGDCAPGNCEEPEECELLVNSPPPKGESMLYEFDDVKNPNKMKIETCDSNDWVMKKVELHTGGKTNPFSLMSPVNVNFNKLQSETFESQATTVDVRITSNTAPSGKFNIIVKHDDVECTKWVDTSKDQPLAYQPKLYNLVCPPSISEDVLVQIVPKKDATDWDIGLVEVSMNKQAFKPAYPPNELIEKDDIGKSFIPNAAQFTFMIHTSTSTPGKHFKITIGNSICIATEIGTPDIEETTTHTVLCPPNTDVDEQGMTIDTDSGNWKITRIEYWKDGGDFTKMYPGEVWCNETCHFISPASDYIVEIKTRKGTDKVGTYNIGVGNCNAMIDGPLPDATECETVELLCPTIDLKTTGVTIDKTGGNKWKIDTVKCSYDDEIFAIMFPTDISLTQKKQTFLGPATHLELRIDTAGNNTDPKDGTYTILVQDDSNNDICKKEIKAPFSTDTQHVIIICPPDTDPDKGSIVIKADDVSDPWAINNVQYSRDSTSFVQMFPRYKTITKGTTISYTSPLQEVQYKFKTGNLSNIEDEDVSNSNNGEYEILIDGDDGNECKPSIKIKTLPTNNGEYTSPAPGETMIYKTTCSPIANPEKITIKADDNADEWYIEEAMFKIDASAFKKMQLAEDKKKKFWIDGTLNDETDTYGDEHYVIGDATLVKTGKSRKKLLRG